MPGTGEPNWIDVGNLGVVCPRCDEEILLPVKARIVVNELGQQFIQTDADADPLWYHAFGHKGVVDNDG